MEKPLQDKQEKGNTEGKESISEGIKLFGDHMELIIVQEWIVSQLERRTYFDYLCFMSLQQHIQQELFELPDDEKLINDRIACNDLLSKVIAGDPVILKLLFHI